jgi:hypothetical protein
MNAEEAEYRYPRTALTLKETHAAFLTLDSTDLRGNSENDQIYKKERYRAWKKK